MLGQEAGLIALGAGFPIDPFGLLLLPQDAANAALADGHHELAHRGPFGQREHVDGFDLLVEGVLELLGDVHRADVPGDRRVDLGVLERKRDLLFVLAGGGAGGHQSPRARMFRRRRRMLGFDRPARHDDPQLFSRVQGPRRRCRDVGSC